MLFRLRKKLVAELRLRALRSILYGRCSQRDALVMTGSPRSGTTWLGQVLSEIPGSSLLFEPIQLNQVPEAEQSGFSWRTYVSQNADWPEGRRYLERVTQGKILNHWTTREMSVRRALTTRFLILKFVRANRMLSWLCNQLPISRAALIIRHPCAVVASQLREGSWDNPSKPEAPEFLVEYPAFQEILAGLCTREEYLAANWAIDNFVPLAAPQPNPWQLLTYEKLVSDFDGELTRLFDAWDMQIPSGIASRFSEPSSVTHRSGMSGLAGWKQALNEEQVHRILNVTTAFGLDFYTERVEPDCDRLYSPQRAERLRAVGSGGAR
jgi:hypothetical protein